MRLLLRLLLPLTMAALTTALSPRILRGQSAVEELLRGRERA